MARPELLVGPDELADYFGVSVLPREYGINVRRLNITDGPGMGSWLDRDALFAYLEQTNQSVGGSKILERIITELRDVTGG